MSTGVGTVAVRLNGEDRRLPAGATVAHVVALLVARPQGCAVALNGEVLPRSAWDSRQVATGDLVEVLTAAPGG